MAAVDALLSHSEHILLVSYKDFLGYNDLLAQNVFNNFSRYESSLNMALTNFIHEYEKSHGYSSVNEADLKQDRYEVAFDQGFTE